jgi:tetratricopeptide (TPR) repeat protein
MSSAQRKTPPVPLRSSLCVWSLLVCLLATRVRADELAAEAQIGPSADANRPELDAARSHVARGESLFRGANYAGALVEFERAHALLVGHPVRYQTLYNIGLCHERLLQYTAAIANYERYLREGGSEASDAAAVRAALATLQGLLGTVALSIRAEENRTDVSFEVWLDGAKVAGDYRTLRVPSGRHTVEVRAAGHEPALREITLSAREHVALEVALEPLARGLPRAVFWSTAAVTLALGITTAALGARTLSLRSELRAKDELARTSADRERLYNHALATDIGTAASGVFLLGSTLLYFLTDWAPERRPASARHLRVLPLGTGLAVSGTFP